MRDAQQKLLLHFEQTMTAVIEWDLAFRVTRWNLAAQQLFGYTPEEALGQHASFIVPHALLSHVNEVWQGLLSQAGGLSSTNENIRKDGQAVARAGARDCTCCSSASKEVASCCNRPGKSNASSPRACSSWPM